MLTKLLRKDTYFGRTYRTDMENNLNVGQPKWKKSSDYGINDYLCR